MTGFCGAFVRNTDPARAALRVQRMAHTGSKALSRNPNEMIYRFSDERIFIAYFDNGAYEPNRAIHSDELMVACVSGDPLIVEENEIQNEPATSTSRVISAIANPPGLLKYAAGSFAAVGWHTKDTTLTLCADKLGLRPIYVYLDPETCVFATNIRTLRAILNAPIDIDEQGLGELIYMRQCLGGRTVYKNVRVLCPAELLTVSLNGEYSKRYFDWNAIQRHKYDDNGACEALYTAFIRAIRRRSRKQSEDAFLSGGSGFTLCCCGPIGYQSHSTYFRKRICR